MDVFAAGVRSFPLFDAPSAPTLSVVVGRLVVLSSSPRIRGPACSFVAVADDTDCDYDSRDDDNAGTHG